MCHYWELEAADRYEPDEEKTLEDRRSDPSPTDESDDPIVEDVRVIVGDD